ncbi:MAG TPA: PhnD/SsuA/transferrin family substrate-binding protein [Methylomirabilota bacterium]|nr:PhnD/SsuA/transferrin family substrate-binding protein [Methylomirabilota bacterium]
MPETFIANARMYAVTPAVETAWRRLLTSVIDAAGLGDRIAYLPYPAPRPLEALWRRPDVGCVLMCGYPIAIGVAKVTPIAAPIPRLAFANGRAVYRSDLVVAAEGRFRTLEDTFGGTAGWTVAHSHSGFNAFRHHLLRYRTASRPTLYRRVVGDLVTARAILDAVAQGQIDVGPLDAYWRALIARDAPDLAARVRTVESTEAAPMPAFVAGPAVPPDAVAALKGAFAAVSGDPRLTDVRDILLLDGFASVDHTAFETTRRFEREALEAGYPTPA